MRELALANGRAGERSTSLRTPADQDYGDRDA
jgi:hypothetical protein